MLHRLSAAALAALLLPACLTDSPESEVDTDGFVAGDDDNFPVSPYSEMFPNGRVNDLLPETSTPAFKDVGLPPAFVLPLDQQSPVRNQASRGVCSIFATGALVEHLYLKAGQPIDISEQYLQWSAKNEVRGFPQSEGSTNSVNLRAVTRYGVVLESDWAYETRPWTVANDAECDGEGTQPTKCFTNGEPSATVRAATKFKLPSAETLRITVGTPTRAGSIKRHLVNNGTAVAIGLDFFYQAWNHGASELPINLDAQARGIVTYPNGIDRERSLAKRAGHAVLIVGYDDTFEAPRYDENGDPLLDGNGQPVIEKGFYIFKNSWGTGRFGRSNAVDPTTGTGVPAGYGYISQRYVHEEADADIATMPRVTPPGQRTFSATPNASIPDNNTTGTSSTITISDAGTIGALSVSLDIAHPYIGDLKVTLTNGTTTVTLHNNTGRGNDNIVTVTELTQFNGQNLEGTWTLKAVDSASSDVGTIRSWSLAVTPR
jgi:hypothetical protein